MIRLLFFFLTLLQSIHSQNITSGALKRIFPNETTASLKEFAKLINEAAHIQGKLFTCRRISFFMMMATKTDDLAKAAKKCDEFLNHREALETYVDFIFKFLADNNFSPPNEMDELKHTFWLLDRRTDNDFIRTWSFFDQWVKRKLGDEKYEELVEKVADGRIQFMESISLSDKKIIEDLWLYEY